MSIVNWTKVLTIACIFILVACLNAVSGCSSSKAKVFGNDMPTMKEVHDQKFHKVKDADMNSSKRSILDNDNDLNEISRETYNQLTQEFKLLPNPVLLIYIYPHLTSGGRPVPGYSSYFKFYREDQYALPGESEGW